MGNISLFDRLFKYVSSNKDEADIVLTEYERGFLERYDFIDNLLRRHRPVITTKQVMNMYMRKFEKSEAQFYRDLQNTQKLYGSLYSFDKSYKKALYVEWLEQLCSISEAAGDYRSAIGALKLATEIMRLNIDDNDKGFKEWQSNVYNLVINAPGLPQGSAPINIDNLQKLPANDFNKLMDSVHGDVPDMDMISKQIDDADAKLSEDD